MRATATAVFAFILTIVGLGAGPLVVGGLNDWIGTADAIRPSLLITVTAASLIAAWFFRATAVDARRDRSRSRRVMNRVPRCPSR
jgi:hypothetical protein